MTKDAILATIRTIRNALDDIEAYIDEQHKDALRLESQNEELRNLLPYGSEPRQPREDEEAYSVMLHDTEGDHGR